ncbi:MAG: type I pullulanase [Lachnospiraceae bacterium]|nr:type I pullulanase [Lachnospiraceae bacterium]
MNKKRLWLKNGIRLDGVLYQEIPGLVKTYRSPAFAEKYTYEGHDLGVVYTKERTCFKLWSPAADAVWVNLFATGSDGEEGAQSIGHFPMNTPSEAGVWSLVLKGDLKNVYYTFTLDFCGEKVETADPYARAAGVNGLRSMVVDLRATDPEGWEEDSYSYRGHQTEAVVWEVHVKDFSHAADSGMEPKGKYAALGVPGTRALLPEGNGDVIISTGTDHLRELGITHVHLLPVAENATVNEAVRESSYNWGYDPLNYNVPEGSFSQDPFHGDVRIRELKEAVLRLHRQGIGVVLDVVYNHTYHTKDSWFERIMPCYYHRTMPDGDFGNASGCGNETASERPMMRRYMLDSLEYWAREYHVDGFRFDLMGIHDVETMNEIRDMLDSLPGKNYLLYGEPWSALPPAIPKGVLPADGGHLLDMKEHIGVFDDRLRDSVKGSCFEKEEGGFVTGVAGTEPELRSVFRAFLDKNEKMLPDRRVAYVSAHDNFTLWDKLTFTVESDGSGFDAPEMLRVAVNKLAAACYLTAQGMVFMQAGEEFGRSKQGEDNSYNLGPEINDIFWSRKARFRELFEYYKGLIAMRKRYKAFTDETGRAARGAVIFLETDNQVGYLLPGIKPGDPRWILVLLNGTEEEKTVELPELIPEDMEWQVLADEAHASADALWSFRGKEAHVYMRSALIAVSEEIFRGEYDTFLFDLDGTIIDSGEGVTNAVAYALTKMGLEVPERSQLNKFIGPPLIESFREFCSMDPETARKAVDLFREYYPVKGMYECFLYEGIRPVLASLKAAGKRLILATSKPEPQAVAILKYLGVDIYFDFLAGASADTSRNKKEQVVAYALELAGIKDLSRVVMVGDRKYDITGARQNGLETIAVLYGYGSRQELEEFGAAYIIHTPADLLKFV